MAKPFSDVAPRGLDQAIAELRRWITDGDYLSPVPLSNALQHIYTLEESSKRDLGDKEYYSIRNADPKGQVVAGIVFARARVTHFGAVVEDLEGQRPFTLGRSTLDGGDVLDGRGVTLRWRPRADLPRGRPERHGRDEHYDQRVDGRDVVDTLEEAREFFTAIQSEQED